MTTVEARDYLNLALATETGCEALRVATGLTSSKATRTAIGAMPEPELVKLAHEVAGLICAKVGL